MTQLPRATQRPLTFFLDARKRLGQVGVQSWLFPWGKDEGSYAKIVDKLFLDPGYFRVFSLQLVKNQKQDVDASLTPCARDKKGG